MAEQPEELKKLVGIANDLGLSAELRMKAIKLIRGIGTYDALLVLLNLAANDKLTKGERQLALKHAGEIVRATG